MSSNCVLGRMSPCDVPRGYDSVAMLSAALLHDVLIILCDWFPEAVHTFSVVVVGCGLARDKTCLGASGVGGLKHRPV
jgi:hypothetical protein